jgi:hypothetical protein
VRNFHFPITVRVVGRPTGRQLDELTDWLVGALARRIEAAERLATQPAPAGTADEPSRGRFDPATYDPARGTYRIPSYDDGASIDVPLEGPAEIIPPSLDSYERCVAHIRSAFGQLGPRGSTYYAAQMADGNIFVVTGTRGDLTDFRLMWIHGVRQDVRGHWQSTGEQRVLPAGRFEYRVVGAAEEEDPPSPNVATVTGLGGREVMRRVFTPQAIGTRVIIDVPAAPATGGAGQGGAGGGRGGAGVVPRNGPHVIRLRCNPPWDTGPLIDPAYAGIEDDDLWRLFLNLCNGWAVDNLNRSERYIQDELVPRYTGPGGATNALSDFSTHNLEHFQEDLRLLRGLMIALSHATEEAEERQRELDSLILRRHRTSRQFISPFGFGAPRTADVFWPTYQEPAPQHAARAAELFDALELLGARIRVLRQAILQLVEEEPLLTRFMEGLTVEDGRIAISARSRISSSLAELEDVAEVQRRILDELDGIVRSISRARDKLCRNPERVLDVPLVYEAVFAAVRGHNDRFDQLVVERIAAHQRQEAWIDIGLSAVGIALFVGGLIVSLAGGPAGVVIFLGAAGTATSAGLTARSVSRAGFASELANVSVRRGAGLVTLEAAEKAEFWARVDVALLGVEALLAAPRAVRIARQLARGRGVEATARLAGAAEEYGQRARAAQRLDFDELFERATPRGQLPMSQDEVRRLGTLAQSSNISDRNLVGALAEEVVERTARQSGDYLPLATKFRGNQGIDSLLIRRNVLEDVFGSIATPADARRILREATDEQMARLGQALRRGRPDDLVSVEVKFSRSAQPVHELLAPSRGGVQQNQAWFEGLMAQMRRSSNDDIRATARLLEEVIGTDASGVSRLARVGIRVERSGTIQLSRLTDDIIDFAHESKRLYQSRRYHGFGAALLRAHRAGDAQAIEKYYGLLHEMNRRIDDLDRAVAAAQRAQTTQREAARRLRELWRELPEVEAGIARAEGAAGEMALRGLAASTRLRAEEVREQLDQAEADIERAWAALDEADSERERLLDDLRRADAEFRASHPEYHQEVEPSGALLDAIRAFQPLPAPTPVEEE